MKALRKVLSTVVATIMGAQRPVSSESSLEQSASQRVYDDFQQSIASERAVQRARHGKVDPINQRQREALHAALAGGKRQ